MLRNCGAQGQSVADCQGPDLRRNSIYQPAPPGIRFDDIAIPQADPPTYRSEFHLEKFQLRYSR
jgi:hypothetical protein